MAGQDDVQTIKDRLSIVDVVGQYVQLRRAGRNFTARCPFHKERTPSFHISPERGSYMCFGCGEKGDIFSFVERIEGVDFKTALEELAKKAGVTLRREFVPKEEHKEKDVRLLEVCEAAASFFEQALAARNDIHAYLHNRGVTDDTKKTWRIGYAPATWSALADYLERQGFHKEEMIEAGLVAKSEHSAGRVYDRFRGRIMFPIANTQGKIIAFSGRFFEKVEGSREEGDPAKYVNSPETALFKKSRTLYGLDRAKSAIRKADCILLVEGQFDLILAHQSGLPFAVALSGTALTPEHLSLLGRFSKRLVLALDADAAGIRSGLKSALMAIGAGFDVKVPTFPFGKDPADVAKENPELLKAAVRTSKTAVEFFLDILRPVAKDERTYRRVVEGSVLPLIAAMESKIEQEHFIQITAAKLRLAEHAVREEVARRTSGLGSVEEVSEGLSTPQTASRLPLERKMAMLIFYFGKESSSYQRLQELVGAEKLNRLKEEEQSSAEQWRFRFEQELGEHTSEDVIAEDMLGEIARVTEKERFKTQFL